MRHGSRHGDHHHIGPMVLFVLLFIIAATVLGF